MQIQPFERDSKRSNAIRNHSKGIRSIPKQMLTIRNEFEAFKFKFETFERDLKHLNTNSNNSNRIRSIRKLLEAFDCKCEPCERDSKHSNANSNHSKVIRSIRMHFRTIRSKEILSVEMQILTIGKGFEAFKCKL